ncbi:putative protein isoform X1 [Capsicum galapagoense]
MESRLVCELKMLKEGILALVSMQSGQATLPVAISNLIDASNTSDDAGPSSAGDTIMFTKSGSKGMHADSRLNVKNNTQLIKDICLQVNIKGQQLRKWQDILTSLNHYPV